MVCLLPFALSWYQIHASRDRLVDQAQRTHLIAARTAAQRIESRVASLQGLLKTLGNVSDLYLDPGSDSARALVQSAVESEPGLLGLFAVVSEAGDAPGLVFGVRAAALPAEVANPDGVILARSPIVRVIDDVPLLLVSVATARPNLWLTGVMVDERLPAVLQPEELGAAAEVFLVDLEDGSTILAPAGVPSIAGERLELVGSPGIQSVAQQVAWPDIGIAVTAATRVGGTNYVVVSRQPLHQAENLSAELRRSAWTIFAAVSVFVILILALVAQNVVRPIRKLVVQQRELAGLRDRGLGGGGEIAELGEAFAALKRYVNDRESLSEIFIDRYQVLRCIGTGGMGSVYLGLDPKLRRFVALKTLNFELLEGPEREAAFRSLREEAVVAASLAHRNVVAIHDIIEGGQGAFIAMELVDGESLADIMRRSGALPIEQVMPIVVAILRGLSAAHGHGMVHRDIKPGNVLIGRNGDIKVTDFGTAAPVGHGKDGQASLVGTPGYVAPESIIDGQFGERSDIFAVGVLMVECLLGRSLFLGRTAQQIFTRTASQDVDFSDPMLKPLGEELLAVVSAMLAKDPEQRPTADAALDGLSAAWNKPVTWDDSWFEVRTILDLEERSEEKTTQRLVGTVDAA